MVHRVKAILLAVLLAGGAFLGSLGSGSAQAPLSPQAYLPFVHRAPAVSFSYGIQVHAIDDTEHVLSVAHELGMTWIKQQIRWEHVERGEDSYNWGDPDRVSEAAEEAGLNVLFSLVAAPGWARTDDTGTGPPDDYQHFYDFVGDMAARYRGRGHAYEIWNEQNLRREWEGAPLSAADYVEMLSGAYDAIKAADPEAIVVSGGLGPNGIYDPDVAIDDRIYLEQMYQAGLADVCDAVGAHPYGFANPPEVYYEGGDYDPTRGWDDHPSFFMRNTLEDYYQIMSAYGDDDKQIWATEFGWPTVDGMGVDPNPGWDYAAHLDEEQQAAYVTGGYSWMVEWGHVGAAFLWNLNFWPITGPENEMAKFSIVRGDWAPRPAFTALKAMPK
jgi:hypothetical protein